jgi:hypothetical protein
MAATTVEIAGMNLLKQNKLIEVPIYIFPKRSNYKLRNKNNDLDSWRTFIKCTPTDDHNSCNADTLYPESFE